MGRAGIVLGLECSRLARNNADWHRLLEICGLAGTLICDEDGLYDPADFNDRMLLGMKGQLSEAELHYLRSRLRGGILNKARRGELTTPLPVGLVYDGAGKVVLDPDRAVQQAITHLFATFDATGSAHAVLKAFNNAGLLFPRRHRKGPRKGELDWAPLTHSAVLRVLHNPRYAGVFCFGRTRLTLGPDHKTHPRPVTARHDWIAFMPAAHPGYLTLAAYDANQARLAESAAAHGTDRKAGPPREGPALLQGIIVCGRCGRRMTVRYHLNHNGTELPTYVCQQDKIQHDGPDCQDHPRRRHRHRHQPAAHRHPHPAGRRGRAHRRRRTRTPRRTSRPAPRRRRRPRPLPHRPRPPPLPRRRPRQPAGRRHPRSRLQQRPAQPA
jgi:DNA invertase Pin-like site-specific DNA recombinase